MTCYGTHVPFCQCRIVISGDSASTVVNFVVIRVPYGVLLPLAEDMENDILEGIHAESQIRSHYPPKVEDMSAISCEVGCLCHSPLIPAATKMSGRSARDQFTDFKTCKNVSALVINCDLN